jgi:transcriptional regulator with XRE-family HTH domain
VTNGDLRSLGDMLRQAREAQALSIEEVESQTRIRAKFIEALESGDFGLLPSTAHAKGFLRNYAQFLQLDVEQIIEQFSKLTGTGTREVTAPAPPDSPPPPVEAVTRPSGGTRPVSRRVKTVTPGQRTGPGTPLGLGQTRRQQTPPPPTRTEPQRGIVARIFRSNIFAIAVLVIGLAAVAGWSTTRLSTISSADIPSNGQSTPPAAGDSALTAEPTATFRLTSTPESDDGPQILDRIVLSITVDQRTWTEIVVDGESQFQGQALKGQVLRFEGREEIYIRTGNGAGLLVNYNGQDIGPLGERGEVAERFFLIDGQVTPTPTPSLAPTNTGVPTPTPSHTPEP